MQQHEFHPLELAMPFLFLVLVYLVVFRGAATFMHPTVDPMAKMERIELLKKRGHFSQALVYIKELTQDFPSNHVYWQIQADLHHRLQQYLQEAGALEKVFKHSSVPTDVCPQLGRAYEFSGDRARGLEAHKRCLQIEPQNTDFLFYVGNAEERLGHLSEALQKYEDCLVVSVDHLDCTTGKARIFLRQDDPGGALALLQTPELVNKVNEDADALLARALSFRRLDQLEKAQKDLKDAIQLSPNYFDLWLELGKIHVALGLIDEARGNFKVALRLDPLSGEAKNQLLEIGDEL